MKSHRANNSEVDEIMLIQTRCTKLGRFAILALWPISINYCLAEESLPQVSGFQSTSNLSITDEPTVKNAPTRVYSPANTKQPSGIFLASPMSSIDFCSIGGCFDGPYLFANMLINETTTKGAIAQEQGVAINYVDSSGKVEIWTPDTEYKINDVIRKNGSQCEARVAGSRQKLADCLYQALTNGRSGSAGPTGSDARIDDGQVHWRYLGPGTNDGKTALSIAMNIEKGGGSGWLMATDLTVKPGAGNISAFGEERDCNNGNADSYAGSPFFMSCSFIGGGGQGTFPMLAYRYIGSGAVPFGGYGAHYGDFWSGSEDDKGSVVKDAVILDATNSNVTLHALSNRRHAVAFLKDDSNSSVVLLASGKHVSGIDLSRGSYERAIELPPSGFIAFNNSANLLGYDLSTGKLQYGLSEKQPSWTVDNVGNQTISGSLDVQESYKAKGEVGVDCNGPPTKLFRVKAGLIVHC